MFTQNQYGDIPIHAHKHQSQQANSSTSIKHKNVQLTLNQYRISWLWLEEGSSQRTAIGANFIKKLDYLFRSCQVDITRSVLPSPTFLLQRLLFTHLWIERQSESAQMILAPLYMYLWIINNYTRKCWKIMPVMNVWPHFNSPSSLAIYLLSKMSCMETCQTMRIIDWSLSCVTLDEIEKNSFSFRNSVWDDKIKRIQDRFFPSIFPYWQIF